MPWRILIIEDDEAINESLCEVLTARGYDVECARNGHDAITRSMRRAFRPDVIVLDLLMPVMDGITFMRLRVNEPLLERAPVIVVTAQPTMMMETALQPYAVVPKPVALASLLDIVSRACHGQPAPKALAG
jgi:two-component system alkaline phosphatase synthesis response regulator PhoP